MEDKLLVIELDSFSSVPVVYYKGKRIDGKTKVHFKWDTKTGDEFHKQAKCAFEIEHADDLPSKDMHLNTIKKRGMFTDDFKE